MHQNQNQTDSWDDGRGLYFDDPDGHRLEIITRRYGSAGSSAGLAAQCGSGARLVNAPSGRLGW